MNASWTLLQENLRAPVLWSSWTSVHESSCMNSTSRMVCELSSWTVYEQFMNSYKVQMTYEKRTMGVHERFMNFSSRKFKNASSIVHELSFRKFMNSHSWKFMNSRSKKFMNSGSWKFMNSNSWTVYILLFLKVHELVFHKSSQSFKAKPWIY